MIPRWAVISAFLVGFSGSAQALELTLPSNARQTIVRNSPLDSYFAPRGPFADGATPGVVVEGEVRRQAWRIVSPGLTTLQVLTPLREQIEAAGYDIILDCDQALCGGFDFRFSTETLPAPNMHVNLRAFRFLTAVAGDADTPTAALTVMVSTTATAAYVQIIEAGDLDATPAAVRTGGAVPKALTPVDAPDADFAAILLQRGHVVLEGLDFGTGTSQLGAGPFPVLQQLADFMEDQPDVRIALVGHTDSVGALDGNIALSKRRAGSVRDRMIETYGVAAERIDAEGMGYLSPVASNLDPAGREANRRVEAVVLQAR